MTYVGSIDIDGLIYYAFLLPEQGVKGTTEPVYCLINDIGKSNEDGKCYFGRQNFDLENFYCYAVEFTKVLEVEPCVKTLLM